MRFTESLHAVASYDLWANEQFALSLQNLTDQQFNAEIPSSFPSILKTVAHIHGAEGVWHQRLENVTPTVFYKLSENANGNEELVKWLNVTRGLTNLVLSYTEAQLMESCTYTVMNGNTYTSPRWQMIQHCFNHSTYHRGQLVTMMRQVGVTAIPNTDLISYYRYINKPAA